MLLPVSRTRGDGRAFYDRWTRCVVVQAPARAPGPWLAAIFRGPA